MSAADENYSSMALRHTRLISNYRKATKHHTTRKSALSRQDYTSFGIKTADGLEAVTKVLKK